MIDTDYEMIVELVAIAKERGYQFPFTDTALYKDQLLYGNTWVVLVLFSHNFAKAVFGEQLALRPGLHREGYVEGWAAENAEKTILGGKPRTREEAKKIAEGDWDYWVKTGRVKPEWQFHIQALALVPEADRIKYAYEHRLK